MATEMKFKLTSNDKSVIIGILFLMGAHLTTQFVSGLYFDANSVAANGKTIAYAYEANPLMAYLLVNSQMMAIIVGLFMIPALLLATYYVIRSRRIVVDPPIVLDILVMAFMFIAIMDFLNDFSLLLGMLVHAGVL